MQHLLLLVRAIALYAVLSLSYSFGLAQTIEGVPSVRGAEHALDRLSVLVSYGRPLRLSLSGQPSASVYRYRTEALNAEPVSANYDPHSGTWQISNPDVGYAYWVTTNSGLPSYYYLIDYADYGLGVSSPIVSAVSDDPCSRVRMTWNGAIRPIYYYGPSGIRYTLPRELILSYTDINPEDDREIYTPEHRSITVEPSETDVELDAPFVDTHYTIAGDKWTKAFALSFAPISTETYRTNRVAQKARIIALDETFAEISSVDWENLSAPTTLRMQAHANVPTATRALWRIDRYESDGSRTSVLNFAGMQTEYSIRAAGRYRIWLSISNADGGCTDDRFVREVRVTESYLDVPNAFTPGSSTGTNDIFRVKARSLIHFDARIFSRTGQELYRWRDVSGGWDGTYRGKAMATGAYLYTITAEGADGVKYNKQGTVNLIGSEYDPSLGY